MTTTNDGLPGPLDGGQYSLSQISRYEAVYGRDFVSPGGESMALELITQLNLTANQHVLDVGCGLGGSAFLMARRFHVFVDGIDLSMNMLSQARERLAANNLADRVQLIHGDVLSLDRPEHYDAAYSRDVFLHIADKPRLFKVLIRALRPGGRLLFTDYCSGPAPLGEDFSAYVEQRGYTLHTLPEYAGIVESAGFGEVRYFDLTTRFTELLKVELERIATADLDEEIREELRQSWTRKIGHAESGDHRWGLVTALKPAIM